jgi:hypothetical protein
MTDASVAMTGGPGEAGQGGDQHGSAGRDRGAQQRGLVRGAYGAPAAGRGPAAAGRPEQAEEPAQGEEQMSAAEVAELWLEELADQVSVPASQVQDRLLDLWGYLEDGPARVEVERWLTETLRRNLYSVSDISDRMESLLPMS